MSGSLLMTRATLQVSFDDLLGHVIARRRLAADQYAARGPVGGVAALDAVVQMDDVQNVEQLALVLVHALDLHVEQGAGVEGYPAISLDQGGQPYLLSCLICRHFARNLASSAQESACAVRPTG